MRVMGFPLTPILDYSKHHPVITILQILYTFLIKEIFIEEIFVANMQKSDIKLLVNYLIEQYCN